MSLADLITVVIPCHNYARFLGECLESVLGSVFEDESRAGSFSSAEKVRVIVIDDSSSDSPELVVDEFDDEVKFIEFHPVNFGDVHRVRQYGLSLVQTKYVMFLDADNRLHPRFLNESIKCLELDRNSAFVFPVLKAFGNGEGIWNGTGDAPDVVTWKEIESRNYCDAGSVFRAEVLRQTLALEGNISTDCIAADWRMARTVLRAGPWHGRKSTVPLWYRVHSGQMSGNPRMDRRYWTDADLQHEIVTIVVAFSGRWECWWKLREWILHQEWPVQQTRLMILDSTHHPLTVNQLDLGEWGGAGIQIERIDVGRPKLADEDRRKSENTRAEVEAAVSGLYNRAAQMAFGEYLFFLEDDVIPHRPDAIFSLFESMDSNVAAVSGLYQHRYQENAVAFHLPFTGEMYPMDGWPVQRVGGTGFGCLLLRRSLLIQFPLSGDDPLQPHYDVEFASKVNSAGWIWFLDRDVKCDHLVNVDEEVDEEDQQYLGNLEQPAPLPVNPVHNNVTSKCQYLGPLVETNNCSCGAQIDIFHCNRQNMNAVRFWVDEERELERRYAAPEKVTPRELKQILAVCEKCPLFVT